MRPASPSDGAHALEYLEAILAWCIAHPDASTWAELFAAHAGDIDQFREHAVDNAPDLVLLDGAATIVAEHIEAVLADFSTLPELVAWVSAARAIDDLWGDLFAADWVSLLAQRGNTISSGQIVIHDTDDDHLRNLYQPRSLAAPLLRRSQHPGRTTRSILYDPGPTVPVVRFDDSLGVQLRDVLHDASHVATVHPNSHIDELDTATFPIRPKSPIEHVARCVDGVTDAFAADAAIVALPEYTGPEDVTDRLRELRPSRPALVVAGSAQRKNGSVQSNSALVWVARDNTLVPADKPIEILKRVRYEGHLGVEDLTQVASHITVFTGGPWRLVVAICRDLCDDELINALGQLGVNLLVVPACSAKTANLADAASRIGAGAPGIALIANGPRHFPGRPNGVGAPVPDVDVDIAIYHGPTDRDSGWPHTCADEPPTTCIIPLNPEIVA